MQTERQKQHKKYIQSKEWAKIRVDLFMVRGEKCEICDKTKRLHVHHLNYDNWMNEEPEDLIILCKKHHNKIHGIKKGKKRKKAKKKKIKRIKIRSKKKISFSELKEKAALMDIKQC